MTNPTPAALAESIKQDILRLSAGPDALASAISQASCFVELHAYCDANTLGDSEAAWSASTDLPDGPEADLAVQAQCDLLNNAQQIVDQWLRDGRPTGGC